MPYVTITRNKKETKGVSRMQSKSLSHLEVITNQVSGITIGWLIVYYIFPLIGIQTDAMDATMSTVIFFIASYSRMYIIRRVFNRIAKYQYKQTQKG